MNLLSLALLGTGGVLIYSAVKGYDPRDVVKAALSGQSIGNQPAKYVLPDVASFSPTTDPVPHKPGV
jgi:hypothetical protein